MAVSDLQLIQAVTAGERSAFATLDQRYRSRLVAFLQGRQQLSRDEAEDVVQDVYAALVANDCAALRSFEGRSSFYTYLCAIALRRLYRRRRKEGPTLSRPAVALEDPATPEPRTDPRPTDIDAAQVRQAMNALPEPFRICLMLHHFGGLEYHEISSLLGIPANTVATRICRAKRRLKELLVP